MLQRYNITTIERLGYVVTGRVVIAQHWVMRFRTLSRRLAAIVGVAGGGSLLAVVAFSKLPSRKVSSFSVSCSHRLKPPEIIVS